MKNPKKIKVGLILSQPFNYSLGTDSRINAIIDLLYNCNVEIHLFIPVLSKHTNKNLDHIYFLPVLSGKSLLSIKIYELVRKIFNSTFLSRLFGLQSILWNKIIDRYTKQLLDILPNLKLDLIHAQQQIASVVSVRLKYKINIPVMADLHGSFAEEMIVSGLLKKGSKQVTFLRQLEQEICSKSDIIVTISKELKNYFIKMYKISNDKVVIISNPIKPKVKNIIYTDKPKKIVYSGMLTYRDNVDLLIQSMGIVQKKHPESEFHITGVKGEKSEYIYNLAKKHNINLSIWWFTTSEEFFIFLNTCHIALITSTHDLARQMSYPAKLYDYLSVGLPVLANDIGAWTKIIKENKLGIVTESNPKNFALGIIYLLEHPDLRYNYAKNALIFTQNMYKRSKKLLELYEKFAPFKTKKVL